jgi:hypothetical protein
MKNIINCRVDFIYIWQEIRFAKRQFETSEHANFDTRTMVPKNAHTSTLETYKTNKTQVPWTTIIISPSSCIYCTKTIWEKKNDSSNRIQYTKTMYLKSIKFAKTKMTSTLQIMLMHHTQKILCEHTTTMKLVHELHKQKFHGTKKQVN